VLDFEKGLSDLVGYGVWAAEEASMEFEAPLMCVIEGVGVAERLIGTDLFVFGVRNGDPDGERVWEGSFEKGGRRAGSRQRGGLVGS
jgi:hypothetical protein